MVAFADDDRVKAFMDESGDGAVRDVDQGTGGLHDLVAAGAHAVEGFLRGSVGRDHHGVGLDCFGLTGDLDPARGGGGGGGGRFFVGGGRGRRAGGGGGGGAGGD